MYKLPYTGAEIEERLAKLDNLNAENFLLSETTADLYGLSGVDANVDYALKRALSVSSYMAFCANVNSDSLDSAFGKNNEELITGIGLQLAMYSWFKGDSRLLHPFTELIKCNTLLDIASNVGAKNEILANKHLFVLTQGNEYAKNILGVEKLFLYSEGNYGDGVSDFTFSLFSGAGTGVVTNTPDGVLLTFNQSGDGASESRFSPTLSPDFLYKLSFAKTVYIKYDITNIPPPYTYGMFVKTGSMSFTLVDSMSALKNNAEKTIDISTSNLKNDFVLSMKSQYSDAVASKIREISFTL